MMQKALLFLLFSCLIADKKIDAQESAKTGGVNSLASFDIHVPVGVFGESHLAGVGLNYTWGHRRFGQNAAPAQPLGFIATAGVDYFLGKQKHTAGYHFRYGNYFDAYIAPGIMIQPWTKGFIALHAGPAMQLYKGSSDFGLHTQVYGNYFITEKIAIGPGVRYSKYGNTNALWALTARASYAF